VAGAVALRQGQWQGQWQAQAQGGHDGRVRTQPVNIKSKRCSAGIVGKLTTMRPQHNHPDEKAKASFAVIQLQKVGWIRFTQVSLKAPN